MKALHGSKILYMIRSNPFFLDVALTQQKELFKEQKMRSKLEESVARAAEDAQMQINSHKMTNDKLEKLMAGLWENFEATKHGAKMHIVRNYY